ncbi:16S rRNA (uracil(1498)-N(3))-methyltransferase [Fodinicurvata sp. EGI_FJ10296]|uniref:16S rRNA (uracil(1498)-N(3))-methyltransferase n=1 Tax=Fodinicurvata sp. EGI_FJ10296 TaxID=3231908 RepID=UPI003452AA85
METTKSKCRLFVAAELDAGATIETDPGHAHYLRAVLRGKPGDPVTLFNGRDGEWSAEIAALAKTSAQLTVRAQRRPQTVSPDLTLCFAPLKKAALDVLIVKATELGATRLKPVFTDHTDVTRLNTERIAANLREAAEQCERLDVPAIDDGRRLEDLLRDWPRERPLLACAARREAPSIGTVASEVGAPAAILVGPEGGFAERELDLLAELPFVHPVGLGPRILRAETAAITALACWQAVAGDFR